MVAIQLTPNACARFNDWNDYTVLFTDPTLRIRDIKPLGSPELAGGLRLDTQVTLQDDNAHIVVALRTEGMTSHVCHDGRSCDFTIGAIIKVQRMLRLPNTR